MLRGLTQWTTRPHHLATMACEWCSVICANYRNLDEGETLLFLSLQVGFRHQDPERGPVEAEFIHSQHHQSMVDIVFGSQRDDVIGDFLHAWMPDGYALGPPASRTMCAKHLVNLPNPNSSPRLRRLIIQSIGLIGHQEFEKVGVESFSRLLDRLGVCVDDVDCAPKWTGLLLGVINSPGGSDRLSYSYWELLLELNSLHHGEHGFLFGPDPQVMVSLQDAQEWDKLSCWICAIWIALSPDMDGILRDLEHAMRLLFHQRPDSIKKVEG